MYLCPFEEEGNFKYVFLAVEKGNIEYICLRVCQWMCLHISKSGEFAPHTLIE
jgi:hypothetical protein